MHAKKPPNCPLPNRPFFDAASAANLGDKVPRNSGQPVAIEARFYIYYGAPHKTAEHLFESVDRLFDDTHDHDSCHAACDFLGDLATMTVEKMLSHNQDQMLMALADHIKKLVMCKPVPRK